MIRNKKINWINKIKWPGSPLPQQQQQQQLDQSSDYYPAPPPPANRGYPPEPQPAYQPKSKPTENSEQGKTEPSTNQGTQSTDDMYKTLSRSKASLWVDTNQGNIFRWIIIELTWLWNLAR